MDMVEMNRERRIKREKGMDLMGKKNTKIENENTENNNKKTRINQSSLTNVNSFFLVSSIIIFSSLFF